MNRNDVEVSNLLQTCACSLLQSANATFTRFSYIE